ncbi:MAG: CoA transferase [Cohaesibacteraceae bacterium]|nr:CoA transferase [Cohaesibacteraceae bacterium]
MENLSSAGVPCGPINSIDKVFDDEQVKSRNIHIETPRSDGSMIPGVASPIRLSKTPPSYRSAPPGLGEHTEDVLRSVLNKSDEDIQQLAQSGTITIQGTSE